MKNVFQTILFFFLIGKISCTHAVNSSSDSFYSITNEAQDFDLGCFLSRSKIKDNKVYIQRNNVYITSEQIYLKVAKQMIPVQTLSTDEQGLFVSLDEVLDFEEKMFWGSTWICPNPACGYKNYDSINSCPLCGTKKP